MAESLKNQSLKVCQPQLLGDEHAFEVNIVVNADWVTLVATPSLACLKRCPSSFAVVAADFVTVHTSVSVPWTLSPLPGYSALDSAVDFAFVSAFVGS